MPKDIVYFDLETQKLANDVGGWKHLDKMRMSVGVTYSTAQEKYIIYDEEHVDQLIDQLLKADLVVGFNHIFFDYGVLMAYTVVDLANQTNNLDMLLSLEEKVGHRMKLDTLASASLGAGKSADGLMAVKWWREGKIKEIAEYCCFDVKVTWKVHAYGVEHGKVKYIGRHSPEPLEVEVDW
ncbi:MAG: ribonuclease H-like domain-containing protein [Verrucomicrobiales bacterium]|nr:ribonuclease H-like domain-containing protein [Verrucomicrobiales bacterium]